MFKPVPRHGGLGADVLIGGIGRQGVRVLDLSAIELTLSVEFSASNAGTITDGIDTIVFHDIEEIILPSRQSCATPPNPEDGQGQPARVRLAADALAVLHAVPAE